MTGLTMLPRPRRGVGRRVGRWRSSGLVVVLVTVTLTSCSRSRDAGAALPLRLVADVALPGTPSRFDYQDVDPSARRLYLAHLGGSRIDVVDLESLRVVGTVEGVASVHGLRLAPDIGRLFASATGSDEVVTIDTGSLGVLARAPTGSFPDGLAYDPVDARVYVSDESGDDETVLDTAGHALGRVPLRGEAGNVVYDPTNRRVLVNVQTRAEIAVIDPAPAGAGTIERTARLPGCRNNHGLQVDSTAGLAYVACVDNSTLLVLDLASLTVLARVGIGAGADVLALDDRGRRLYVAGESGVVAMFAIDGRDLRKLGQQRLAAKAHSVVVDPVTARVFFPLENIKGHPVLRVMAPG